MGEHRWRRRFHFKNCGLDVPSWQLEMIWHAFSSIILESLHITDIYSNDLTKIEAPSNRIKRDIPSLQRC